MSVVKFVYADMWKHYVKNVGQPSADIYVRVLKADYVAMKYDSKNDLLKPFKHINMDAWKVDDEYFTRHEFFKHGCYIVAEKETESNHEAVLRKKNFFLVGPRRHSDDKDTTTLYSADHLSFTINKGQAETPVHFHVTTYTPFPHGNTKLEGSVTHQKSFMASSFDLPESRGKFQLGGKFSTAMSDTVHDVLLRHLRFADEQRQSSSPNSGGGRRRRHRIKKRSIALDNVDISKMFRTLPIDTVRVIGVRRASSTDKYDVTIIFKDRLRHPPNHTDLAFLVEMNAQELFDDLYIGSIVASCMIGKTWHHFEDVPEP